MKQYTVIVKDEAGTLKEMTVFDESREAVKANTVGLVHIVSSGRIKHPSPEALLRTLQSYEQAGQPINVKEFFTACNIVAEKLAKEEAEKAAQKEKELAEKAKAEADAKSAKNAKAKDAA